jgi:hypothetical protein
MSTNTIGHSYPEPIPVDPRFLKRCYTHPKDEDAIIDPTSKEASLAKETSDGKIQCYHCQVRELEDIMLMRLPPDHDKVDRTFVPFLLLTAKNFPSLKLYHMG